MYNVKISEYLNSTEISLYSVPISSSREKERDGIIIERNNKALEIYSFMAFHTKKSKEELTENKLHSFFVSYNRTKNRIYNYARANNWEWFLTFTFNPKFVDSYNYDEIVKVMHEFLRHMGDLTKKNRSQYLIVPEKHKSGRYHLHGIFSNLDINVWKFQFSGHVTKGGLPIFNIGCFKYGFTTATQVQSSTRVSHYISKYITKDMFDSIKNKKRYWVSRNVSDGIHQTLMMNKNELDILLSSFGECEYMKTVETPYNTICYYQF